MQTRRLAFGLFATASLLLGGCNKPGANATGVPNAQTATAQKAAGTETIASGMVPGSRFMTAAKSAGLDQTLAGPGPYTVFVPDDAAFNGAVAGTPSAGPRDRAQATGLLTGLILPGTVLAADIDKSIDRSKGKALLLTMSGGVLSASKDGGKTVLTDAAGHKATITQADELYSNGVVHHIDALLMPGKSTAGPAIGKRIR